MDGCTLASGQLGRVIAAGFHQMGDTGGVLVALALLASSQVSLAFDQRSPKQQIDPDRFRL